MSNLTIKLIKKENSTINSIESVINELELIFTGKHAYHTIEIDSELNDDELKAELDKSYDLTIRDGVSGGCYGARDGKSYSGFTLFADLINWDDRFIDTDYDEIVNPYKLIQEYASSDLKKVSDELTEEFCDAFDSKDENTYNYQGNNKEDARFLTDFHFRVISKGDDDKQLMFVRFHNGGDIRGNYGSWYLTSFDSIEDLYSVIYPRLELLDEENLDEIERLKELIWQDPADKELLIKELNELIG